MILWHRPRQLCLAIAAALVGSAAAAEAPADAGWDQWRGPGAAGVATASPPLRRDLPADGLKPAWLVTGIPSGFEGGWGCPIVADGKVYLYVHANQRKPNTAEPPKAQYPWLPPDRRGKYSPKEFEDYERNRRDEDERIGKDFYTYSESLRCWDLATGKELWNTAIPSVYTRFLHSGTPAAANGKVLFVGAGRVARAFDAATGKQVWETKLPGDFRDEFVMSSFTVVDGVAGVLAGELFGIEAATGKVLWQSGDKARGDQSSPAPWLPAGRPGCFVVNAQAQTVCFEAKTGKELWRVASEAGNATPVVVGDRVLTYGRSAKSGLRSFRMAADGATQEWVYQGIADKGSSPVAVGDAVYVQGDRRLHCVGLADGQAKWKTLLEIGNAQYTSLAAAGGAVFYAYDGVLMFAADPSQYRLLGYGRVAEDGLLASPETLRRRLGVDKMDDKEARKVVQEKIDGVGVLDCASPALANGRLVVRLKNGLACYDLADPAAAAGAAN